MCRNVAQYLTRVNSCSYFELMLSFNGLDLTAGFDTIDHSLRIERMSLWCGISGTV